MGPELKNISPVLVVTTVTIANGASLSGIINLRGGVLVGIQMPAIWTAANLTFQGSSDGVTFGDVYEDRGLTELQITAAASRFLVCAPNRFASCQHLKVRSGTTGTPVNQGADRIITLIIRPM